MLFHFSSNFLYLSSDIKPILCPIGVNLSSALSCLNNNLYSALELNILYGSFVFFTTISSINTPMYASFLESTTGSSFFTYLAAFIPAIIPCDAASSYPDVPLICPALNNPFTFFNSNVFFNSYGSKQSYSIAYAGLVNSAFSNPFIVL